MNWDIIEGDWNEFKGRIREKWGKLTDDDLDVIDGQEEQLIGFLQKRYGLAKDGARKQVREFCEACERNV